MKKRFLAKVMCLIMIANCFVCGMAVSAEEVTPVDADITYSGVQTALGMFGDYLTGMGAGERVTAYHDLKDFIATDAGMDMLLDWVAGVDTLTVIDNPATAADKLVNFIISMKDYKNEMLLALSFLKSIPEENRAEAFSGLEEDPLKALEYNSASNENAVENVYEALIADEAVRTMLADAHGIDAAVFMQMATCMTGLYTITDDANRAYLALSSIDDPTFEDNLVANVSKYFDKLNGKKTARADNILNAILLAVNEAFESDTGLLADIKITFLELDMYEEAEEEEESSGSSSGSSSNRKYPPVIVTPEPTQSPIIITPVESTFSDINGHWAKSFIDTLNEKNVVAGYEDNTFRPENAITRQEMAVMLVRALGIENQVNADAATAYSDDAEIASWAKPHVALLTEQNIYRGYGEGHFGPNRNISREEVVALISRLVTKEPTEMLALTFGDADQIKEWFVADVEKVYSLGLIRGYEDGTFRPEGTITRAEAATIIYNFMSSEGKI